MGVIPMMRPDTAGDPPRAAAYWGELTGVLFVVNAIVVNAIVVIGVPVVRVVGVTMTFQGRHGPQQSHM